MDIVDVSLIVSIKEPWNYCEFFYRRRFFSLCRNVKCPLKDRIHYSPFNEARLMLMGYSENPYSVPLKTMKEICAS